MTAANRDLVLGVDVGTSALKAALYTPEGALVASGSAGYPLHLPAPGWAEQNPLDWWSALCRLTQELAAATDRLPSRIAAIGIAAQMCGVVPLAADGTTLHNALIWLDTRSEAIARRAFGGRVTFDGYGPLALLRFLPATGGLPNLSGKDPLSKILWLRETRPDLWRRTDKLLDVKDYLVHRCTGEFTTTPDCAHLWWLFDARPKRRRWSARLLNHLELDAALLPRLGRATAVAGRLHNSAAEQLGLQPGIPIAGGLGDVSAFAFAAGAEMGAPHLHIGTSGWLGVNLARPKLDIKTRIGSICGADFADYLLIAAQECAGICVGWAAAAMGFGDPGQPDLAAFERAAARAKPRLAGPYFLPWLYGERVPIDDPHVRGGFANLSIDDGAPELARAVLEGVALNLRWAERSIEHLIGAPQRPIRLLGAGAENNLWCQIIADVMQRPIERMARPRLGGTLGAAMTAAVAAGWYPDRAGASAMVAAERLFTPAPELGGLYDRRFEHFVRHYRALKPWYRRVAAEIPSRSRSGDKQRPQQQEGGDGSE